MNNMINNHNPLQTMKPLFAALLLAASPLAAQAASPVLPGAGDILQQIAPLTPPAFSPSGTGLTIEWADGAKLPPSAPFLVKSIQITNNTLFDIPTLRALVADAEGKSLSLSQLGKLAARITSHYRNNGYPLARAIIPAQTIAAGMLRIEIIEARYDQITLDNRSRVKDALLQATLAPLQSGQFIEQTKMNHVALLFSDIPGVVAAITLRPGKVSGTSDMLVSTTSSPMVTGSIQLDNFGNLYTGRYNIGGTVNVINPLQHGDILSASGLSSGSGMDYARLSYVTLLNGQGTQLGGAYSVMNYALGDTLIALQANGSAREVNLWTKHPLIRARNVNLYGQLQFDSLQLQDHIDATNIKTDRSLESWTLSLSGGVRDANGINTWKLDWRAGRVGFDNAVAQVNDAGAADTQGTFSKLNVNLTRLQNLNRKNDLYLAFASQWANDNLDASQKMSVGGPSNVRAYDSGAISGDTGYNAHAELRHIMGTNWGGGQWQAVAFVDTARVKVNENTWVAGTNSATLSGAGVGLNWAGPQQWRAKAYMATSIGDVPTLVTSSEPTRAWIDLSKKF
jgi:hemolysin activation/secretion protein